MRWRNVVLAVVLVVLAVLLIGAFSVTGMMGYGYDGRPGLGRGFIGPGMMGGYGFLGPVFMLAFWLIVIVGGAVLLVRGLGQGPSTVIQSGQGSTDRALQVLRERYAKGEITKEQFDQMLRDLNSVGAPPQ
jgi:putative membrane protein